MSCSFLSIVIDYINSFKFDLWILDVLWFFICCSDLNSLSQTSQKYESSVFFFSLGIYSMDSFLFLKYSSFSWNLSSSAYLRSFNKISLYSFSSCYYFFLINFCCSSSFRRISWNNLYLGSRFFTDSTSYLIVLMYFFFSFNRSFLLSF